MASVQDRNGTIMTLCLFILIIHMYFEGSHAVAVHEGDVSLHHPYHQEGLEVLGSLLLAEQGRSTEETTPTSAEPSLSLQCFFAQVFGCAEVSSRVQEP